MNKRELIHIRDPIHGTIVLSPAELDLVETPVFQRLRGIKQLGFADHAFPGATHSRFAHSLGAMEMATRIFDAVFPAAEARLPEAARRRFRQLLRLAVLMHDLGHAPLSHATEGCMPARKVLDLPLFEPGDDARQANHEDYTALLLLRSELSEAMRARFEEEGISPEDVANLITGVCEDEAQDLLAGGVDYGPLMRQIVSGELDADRMDYLQRDSYHAGVDYGRFDRDWILTNVDAHIEDGKAFLALHHRAIFAFEDFLLSRYHMFVSVYYHHTSVGFDAMLARFVEATPGLTFPLDAAGYVAFDDVAFWSLLRASDDPWARRIVRRDLYRRVLELNAADDHDELASFERLLGERGVDYFVSRDQGVLSRYYGVGERAPIFVLNRHLARATRVDRYSKLYERYAQPARLTRIYCRPDQLEEARATLKEALPRHEQLKLTW